MAVAEAVSADESGRLSELERAVADGVIHTVRVTWSDRLGTWRGKRVPVDLFLRSPHEAVAFVDGMLVVDVQCDITEETPFSNYRTGYPDFRLQPDLTTLRRAPWTVGEAYVVGDPCDRSGRPLAVAPRVVLKRVVERMTAEGVAAQVSVVIDGRLMTPAGEPVRLDPGGLAAGEASPGVLRTTCDALSDAGVPIAWFATGSDPGSFRIALGEQSPLACADEAVVVKAALKEVAVSHGFAAVFMTLVPGAVEPSLFRFTLQLEGLGEANASAERISYALADARALLQPSITAFKAGAPTAPVWGLDGERVLLSGLASAAESDPVTALAALLSATCHARNDSRVSSEQPSDLGAAATRLRASSWVTSWLGSDLVANTVPLLKREAELFAAAITDWEVERYFRLA
jgi:glutamine synthetase